MYRIVRDASGALMHVRTEDGECIGCIEVGLYEVLRNVIVEDIKAAAREGEGAPRAAAAKAIVALETGR